MALVMALGMGSPAAAEEKASADVVVLVDTSTSMKRDGMDPQWTSLLVTKLFTDIVPGDLAVVRLLDLEADKAVLPRSETDRTEPCAEDPSQQCRMVEPATDWQEEARRHQLGALPRPRRGDAEYKRQLEGHLDRRINNSFFDLSFRAAQGILAQQRRSAGTKDKPQTVLWLSDGESAHPPATRRAIQEIRAEGVAVEAIVFGQGSPLLARSEGLEVQQVSSPAQIMKAFAGSFRRVVQAPYEIDNLVASRPEFEMKANVDEAWVVVYGGDDLGEVRLLGPSGEHAADYAADRWAGAGAYRVAYFEKPAAGRWVVEAAGGGTGVAYAVVQRSALNPAHLEPEKAVSGRPTTLVAGVRAGLQGELLVDPSLLQGLTLTARFQDQEVILKDDGLEGDAVAGDGRFSAPVTFTGSDPVSVELRLLGDVVDRSLTATVNLSGSLVYRGGPVSLDFGVLEAGNEACLPLKFEAQQEGEVPLELRSLETFPPGVRLAVIEEGVTADGQELLLDGRGRPMGPSATYEICLRTSRSAPSSVSTRQGWAQLGVEGTTAKEQRIPLELSWQIQGLTFWQRWGWLVLLIFGLLVLVFLVGGFVVPARFRGGLSLTFVPDRGELNEQIPQPIKQWKGVGIGFYRSARAYLHGDFRLSGEARGGLAVLRAEKGGNRVLPGKGAALYRETLVGDWETVSPAGRRGRAGDVYRIGDKGPFFRISTQRGRR